MGLFDKMNFFKRKISDENNIISNEVVVRNANLSDDMYPLSYSVGYLKNRTTDLVREETGTAERIKGIEYSFSEVRGNAEEISASITNFTGQFNEMENFSNEFNNKIINILKSLQDANSKVLGLRDSSKLVEDSFEVIQSMFENIEKHYTVINEYTSKIMDIADKTNKLVLNVSTESAKIGDERKEVTIVPEDISELAEKIKKLRKVATVNVGDIEKDINQINVFHKHLKKAMDRSSAQVNSTEEVLDDIKTDIYVVSNINEMISVILNESNIEVKNIRENIKKSTQYYSRVTEDIDNLNNQMTNKGIIFEDIANFLDQMDYLLDDIENKR